MAGIDSVDTQSGDQYLDKSSQPTQGDPQEVYSSDITH